MHIVALIFAIAGGVVILVGFFVPALAPVQQLLLGWAMLIAATATIVGILNLILVHGTRIQNREKGAAYSAILLTALFATFVFALMLRPEHADIQRLVNAVVVPAETSLMALLTISLIFGSIRLVRRRANMMSVIFLATAAIMLLASATLPLGGAGGLANLIRALFNDVLALGGARGLIIGVALGSLVTGVRVLMGADRPYQGG